MTKTRFISMITLVFFIFSLAFAACSKVEVKNEITDQKASAQTEEKSDVQTKEKEKISIWYHTGMDPKYHEMLFDGAKDVADITQTVTPAKDYTSKLDLAISSGTAPDIAFLLSTDLPKYVSTNKIQNCNDVYDEILWNDLPKSWQDQSQYKGDKYFVPYVSSVVAIFYNKQLLKETGLEEPKNNWSYEEFESYIKKLTKKNDKGNTIQFGIQPSPFEPSGKRPANTRSLMPYIWSFGGELLSPDLTKASGYLNSEKNIKALEFQQMLYNEGYAPKEDIPNGFETGKIAMKVEGSWALANWRANFPELDLGVVSFPVKKDASVVNTPDAMFAWGWSIMADSKKKDTCVEVLKAAVAEENLLQFAEAGGVFAARNSVLEKQNIDELQKELTSFLSYSRGFPTVSNTPEYYDALYFVYGAVAFGENVKETLDKAAEQIDKAFK